LNGSPVNGWHPKSKAKPTVTIKRFILLSTVIPRAGNSVTPKWTRSEGEAIVYIRFATASLFGFFLRRAENNKQNPVRVKYWEIIADNLKKRGWSLGYALAVDSEGRTVWIADAHCGDGKRFIVRADQKLTAFMELQAATAGQNPAKAGGVKV
jgi:hypothetical protein